jgi:hypothetical protein
MKVKVKTAADNVKEVLGGKYFKTMKGFNYAIMRSVR